MPKRKGPKKAERPAGAEAAAAPVDLTDDQLSNPENFVDGLGYRGECTVPECSEVTDGGAVIRATGARYALCPPHRNPEGLAEAIDGLGHGEEPESPGSTGDAGGGGAGDGDPNAPQA